MSEITRQPNKQYVLLSVQEQCNVQKYWSPVPAKAIMRVIPNEPKAASTCRIYYPKNCKVSNVLTLLWHAKNYCHWCCLVFSNGCSSWEKEKKKIFSLSTTGLLFIDFLPCWFKCEYSAIRHQNHLTRGWQKYVVSQNFAIIKLLVCHLSSCPLSAST